MTHESILSNISVELSNPIENLSEVYEEMAAFHSIRVFRCDEPSRYAKAKRVLLDEQASGQLHLCHPPALSLYRRI